MKFYTRKQFLFALSILSFYYIFLLFPPIKEVAGALEMKEIYIYVKIFSILFLFFTFTLLLYPKINVSFKSLNIYMYYSIFHISYLILIMKYNIKYILFSFYDTFSILFLTFIFFYIKRSNYPVVNKKDFLYLLGSIFLVILIYGFLQKIYNSPLMYYEFDFYYISQEIHNLRVFSILPSRIQFGKMTALMALLMICYIFYSKNKFKIQFILIMIFSLIGTYISTERTSLILFVLGVLNLTLLKIGLKFKKIVFLNLLISILLPFILISLTFTYSLDDSIFRTNSLIDRLYWWGLIIDKYIVEGNLINILLGYGIIQTTDGDSFSSIITNGKLWIDNLYLTIFLYQGVIGLGLFISVYVKFIFIIHNLNTLYSKYFSISLVSWMISSVFARSIGDMALLTILPSIIYLNYNLKEHCDIK